MVLTPERIELHAVGFNAWSQLNLRPSNERIGARYEPEDIKAFTQVLTDVGKDFAIVDVQPCLTYTLGTYLARHLMCRFCRCSG
jgi:hypothetical protein